MGVVKSEKVTTKKSTQLKSGGIYTIPKAIVVKPTTNGEYDCLITSDSRILCGKRGCTDSSATNYDAAAKIDDGSCSSPTPTPTTSGPTPAPTPTPTGTTGGGVNVVGGNLQSYIGKQYHKQNLHTRGKSKSSQVHKDYKQLYDDLRTGSTEQNKNLFVAKLLRVQWPDTGDGGAPDNKERIVLWGRDLSYDRPRIYKVERKNGTTGPWGWIDDEIDENGRWTPFDAYNKLNESIDLSNILSEQEQNSLSEMIDNKLKEFNFYTANEKGKQRVVFTDDDREEISREFDDLIKKYPEDIAFIRAVVIAKGEDKKTGEPVVRLGSYYNNANIELPFNSQMNGLGKLLDGGIVYFTVLNNEGPDYRDFKIVGGDKIPEVDFNDKEKEEIETDSYVQTHNQEMEKEEPFEEVMKEKEKKGLQSLLDGEGLTNELTKRQKEILENLKKKGFKFDKPENADIYERVRINSREFNESINAWRPKK
jgi:hypothetical protein